MATKKRGTSKKSGSKGTMSIHSPKAEVTATPGRPYGCGGKKK